MHAFEKKPALSWSHGAPKINDFLMITSNQTGENVTKTNGLATLELLDKDWESLDTPIKVKYQTKSFLGGFVLNGGKIVRVNNHFNVIQFSDENPFAMELFEGDTPIEHAISWSDSGLILNGMSTVFCERLTDRLNREDPDIQALVNSI